MPSQKLGSSVGEPCDAIPSWGSCAQRSLGKSLVWLSDLLNRCTILLAALLMAMLVVVMFIGVVYRYVLNDALAWSEEIAGFAMGWLVFLGAAVLFRTDGHPASTLLLARLNGSGRQLVTALAQIVSGAYLVIMTASGIELLQQPQPHSPALSLSYAVAYIAIPISGGVMLVHWLRQQLGEGPLSASARINAAVVVSAGLALGCAVVALTGSGADWLDLIPTALLWLVLPAAFILGVPISIVLGFGATLFITSGGDTPLSIVAQRAYAGIDNATFLAIPAFMLTGALMLVTGMSEGLVSFASLLVGRIKGGLALADVVASVLFADISGSAVADTATIGNALMPGMVQRGYDRDFVAAHQAASGSLGTLFPPSISMIIFATVTSVSVTGLFVSSIVPGLLVAGTYMLIAYLVARRRGYPREKRSSLWQIMRAMVSALPSLVAPVIVLGGILFGVFTPYEAGAVAAVYVAVVGVVLRPGSVRSYGEALVEGSKMAAMVMFIIANASVLAWVMISQQIPQEAAAYVGSLAAQPIPCLFMTAALLIALSIFLEPPAILIAVVPIMLPIVNNAGVSPLRFGVVVMMSGAIGMLLPPIGITLLVSVAIIRSSIERAARAAIPYVAAACFDLTLVIVFPGLTSWLPHFFHA